MAELATTPRHFESMIADKMIEALEEWCIERVPTDDDSRADVVIFGHPRQERKYNVVLSVHLEHPFGPVMDTDSDVTGLRGNRAWLWPRETVGGMRTSEIIGCVQINLRQSIPQATAAWVTPVVKERVKQAVNRDRRLKGFTDDLGNTVSVIEAFKAIGYSSGGGNVSVHHGWVDWRAYVHNTNCRES